MANLSSQFLATFKTQEKSQQLSHAYLLLGGVLGDSEVNLLKNFFQVTGPDLFVLFSPIKIGHIRELIRSLAIRPHSSAKRLAILTDVETMTLEAANAFLKILEEPPPYVVFVLSATQKAKILPTILSRCQLIRQKSTSSPKLPEKNYLKPGEIAQMTIKDRFDYIAKINAQETPSILNRWEEFFRANLLSGQDARAILKDIAKTRSLLSTNTSVKLLLENLVLKF